MALLDVFAITDVDVEVLATANVFVVKVVVFAAW